MYQHPVCGVDTVRLSYVAELQSKTTVEDVKQCQKALVGQDT